MKTSRQRLRNTGRLLFALAISSISGLTESSLAQEPVPTLALPPAPANSRPAIQQLLVPPAAKTFHAQDSVFLGSQSCASTACHGETQRVDLLKSAYVIFSENDPHQRAGSVLFNERSENMVKRLNYDQPAWKSESCLVCHAPGGLHAHDNNTLRVAVSEGVSCESCHGPARDWLEPHRSVDWRHSEIWSAERKASAGFRVTKSLESRARMCADCHVGSEKGQVTHDLIAAGHPRLLYEFSGNQALMPAHWNRSHDRLRVEAESPHGLLSFEAISWLLGQLVSADRELELLAHAARDENAIWPELSQFDCFSCHHDLKSDPFRQTAPLANPLVGRMRWGTWNVGMLGTAPEAILPINSQEFSETNREIERLLQGFSNDRNQITALASTQRDRIDALLQAPRHELLANRNIKQIRDELLQEHERLVAQGWDSSTQYFLAIVALQQGLDEQSGLRGISDPELVALLREIRGQLAYRNESLTRPTVTIDSPRYFDGGPKSRVNELFGRYQVQVSLPSPASSH